MLAGMVGMVGMVIFNLVDTCFVSKLGTSELAAMSFTLPVVLLQGSISMGLGVGASSVISHLIGRRDQNKVKRQTTDSLLLSFLIVLVLGFTHFPLSDNRLISITKRKWVKL